MAASMFLPAFAAIGLMGAGVVDDFGTLMVGEHIAMFPGMLVAMLIGPEEYSSGRSRPRRGVRMRRKHDDKIDGLVVVGLTELALGALTGWPMSVAVSRPEDLPKVGIRSGARLRQWHLDRSMLGILTAAAPRLVTSPPRKVAVPLAVGAWVNANAFGVLAFRPELKDHPVYRAGVASSFVAASWGFAGLAAVAWKRWLEQR